MDQVFFKDIDELRFRYCFSIMKTFPKLFGDKRPMQIDCLYENPKDPKIVKQRANDLDMMSVAGLKAINYFILAMLVSNYF